jgi:hypothetical protein
MFYNIFGRSCCLWDNVEKYWLVESGRRQMTIWHIRIAYWIPKATNTYSEYVTLTDFLLQQLLHECASTLCFTYSANLSQDNCFSESFFAIWISRVGSKYETFTHYCQCVHYVSCFQKIAHCNRKSFRLPKWNKGCWPSANRGDDRHSALQWSMSCPAGR